MPSGGKLLSGAVVRTVIQWSRSQPLAGRVMGPRKVAPACTRITSPHDALFKAALRFPPADT